MSVRKRNAIPFLFILILLSLHVSVAAAESKIKAVETLSEGSVTWVYNKNTGKRIKGLTGIHELPAKSRNYYYFKSSKGQIYARGWFRNEKGYLYADKKGRLKTGLQKVGGKTYYFHPKTHVRMTGWQTIGKKHYYFQSDGTMRKGLFPGMVPSTI